MANRLVGVLKAAHGDDHPDTLVARSMLGGAYLAQGRSADAEALLVPLLAAQERLLGERHPNALQTRSMLAAIHQGQGRLAEAEAELRGVLIGDLGVYGDAHPLVGVDRRKLACVLLQRGQREEALGLLRENVKHNHSPLPTDETCPTLSADPEVVELAKGVPRQTDPE